MRIVLTLALCILCGSAFGQSVLSNLNTGNSGATQLQLDDLRQTQVDLGFDFPFYEQAYDEVWVTYTGALNFQNSTSGSWFCCTGRDLTNSTTQANTKWDYSIFGLWTDLDIEYVANPWYKTTDSMAIFGWYNVPEWYRRTSDVSSFELELYDTGEIKFLYDEIDVVNHAVTIGVTGDASEGQYYQFEYRPGGWTTSTPFTLSFNTQTGVAVDSSGNSSQHTAYPVPSTTVDPCLENPASCGQLNLDVSTSIANFNTGPEIFGDDITDFIDDPSLNFGPDPFETYEQTLLTSGPGTGQDGFFDSSFDGFDSGVSTSMFSDDSQFDGQPPQDSFDGQPPQETFDGQPPQETFDGQPPQDSFGAPPPDDFTTQSFEDIAFDTPGDGLPEIETFNGVEDTSIPPPGAPPPPPGAEPPPGAPPPPDSSYEKIAAEEITEEFNEPFEEDFEEPFEEDFEEPVEEIAPLPEEVIEVAETIAVEAPAPGKPVVAAAPSPRAVRAAPREAAGPRTASASRRVNAARRVDAVSIARSQIQASEELVQGAVAAGTVSSSGSARDIVPSQSQGPSYGAPITEQSIVENIINQNSGSSDGSIDFSSGNMGSGSAFGTFGNGSQTAFNDSVTIDFSFGSNDPIFVTNFSDTSSQQTDLQGFSDNSSQSGAGINQNFGSQTDQALSTGGSITEAITAELPDFSRFDVSPLPEEEQDTVDRAERQMENMSDSAIENNLDTFVADMQTTGGFDSNQGLTLVLMNRVNGFNQYGSMLQDTNFYTTQSMLQGGNLQNDRNAMLQLIGTNGKHREMVEAQYE